MISFLITLIIAYYFGAYILLFSIGLIAQLWPYIKIALIISAICVAIKIFFKYKNKKNRAKMTNKER